MARVLIVEDNADQLRILRDALAQDHAVETARLAEDGIELARTFRPDIAILDLHLPAMNGLDAARCLRRDHGEAGIRIIMLTGSSSPAELKAVLESGSCDAYLAKPASLAAVRRTVAELLAAGRQPA